MLAATIDSLTADGFADLTVEAVAARSGVHRTTIHRRWSSRASLVADALLEISAAQVSAPDTGQLRSDLRRFARGVRDALSSPLARAIISAVAQPKVGAELVEVSKRFWDTRFAATRPIVERAIQRGELPRGADARFVIEALGGPIWFRTFVVGELCDDRFLDRVVDTILTGLEEGDT